jgi:hypothetical protein
MPCHYCILTSLYQLFSPSHNYHMYCTTTTVTTTADTTMLDPSPVAPPPVVASSVIIPLEEFAEDLDLRLGRANGNIYHRKAGVDGVHDGQIMVRLKKKRFIIIDYGILPSTADLQAAAINPHVSAPDGAGKTQCVSPNCVKVGVPVLLYDSEPTETASLYMRSGLCFMCQRNLNEKRRTQRKRKSDIGGTAGADGANGGSAVKRVKLNGEIIELTPDALIINGPMGGGEHDKAGHAEIGVDLVSMIRDASTDVQQLVVQNRADSAVAYAAAAAAATSAEFTSEAATNAAVDASNLLPPSGNTNDPSPTATTSAATDNVAALYEKAFHSTTRSLYLLSLWKAAWDASNAVAAAAEAAIDAAAAGDQTAMLPLLLAAEGHDKEGEGEDDGKDGKVKEEDDGEVFGV